MKNNETVIMFSGGTDSTLAAALEAKKFDRVHLLTYDRFGLFSVGNSQLNVLKLKDKFGQDKFISHIVKIDKLTEYVFYERYLHNLRRHGFFLLSICGLCKLAMHIRTLIFCIDNDIGNVSDGANQGMYLFPEQTETIIEELKQLYNKFGITYNNPVFNYAPPENIGFADRFHLESLLKETDPQKPSMKIKARTTGCTLHKMGLMPAENVKGTELDRKMQPRCFQFILFNIFIKWYYLYDHSYEEYVQANVKLYRDKISHLTGALEDYVQKKKNNRFANLIER